MSTHALPASLAEEHSRFQGGGCLLAVLIAPRIRRLVKFTGCDSFAGAEIAAPAGRYSDTLLTEGTIGLAKIETAGRNSPRCVFCKGVTEDLTRTVAIIPTPDIGVQM